MKYCLSVVISMICVLPVMAQDWALRSGDELFSEEELHNRLAGQTLTFYDDGQSKFGPNGGYSYTYDFGGIAYGIYDIRGDSTVCIQFENGASRCDMYVRNATRLILLTEDGQRFPVRPAS